MRMFRRMLFIASLAIAFVLVGCTAKTQTDTSSSGDSTTTSDGTSGTDSTQGQGTMGTDGTATMAGDLESVYFGFDKFIIEGSANIQTIRQNAQAITDSTYEVRVEGNTDEWGSDEYNYALALKRASSVKDALEGNNVPSAKIKLVSYGESKPKCTEKTRECWRENRRVDFVLIPNQ